MTDLCGDGVNGTVGPPPTGDGEIPISPLHFRTISGAEAAPLIIVCHYKHASAGSVSHAFGAYVDDELIACVTFGPPSSPQVVRSVGVPCPLVELNRLVVADYHAARRNVCSALIGYALRQLPAPMVVVSYADTAQGHAGIVYRATNFLYAGTATSHDSLYRLPDGAVLHPRTLAARGITAPVPWARTAGAVRIRPEPKHRYLYVIAATRTERKTILASVRWPLAATYPMVA